MPDSNIDWQKLKAELVMEVMSIVMAAKDDAVGNLDQYAESISNSMIFALKRGDHAHIKELRLQAKSLGELNAIRLSDSAWKVAEAAIGAIFKVLLVVI